MDPEKVTIAYAITVPVTDNAALGGPSAIEAAAVATYDAAASGTGGTGVTTFVAALAHPDALGSDVDQSTISSLDSSSADFIQAITQVPSGKAPIYFITLPPGMWRGVGDSIDGLVKCENSAGEWFAACVGGSNFDTGYCREHHAGPLCALCQPERTKTIVTPKSRARVAKERE